MKSYLKKTQFFKKENIPSISVNEEKLDLYDVKMKVDWIALESKFRSNLIDMEFSIPSQELRTTLKLMVLKYNFDDNLGRILNTINGQSDKSYFYNKFLFGIKKPTSSFNLKNIKRINSIIESSDLSSKFMATEELFNTEFEEDTYNIINTTRFEAFI